MVDAVFANPEQQKVLNAGASFEELRNSRGGLALFELLNECVRDNYLAILTAKTSEELFDLRGQGRAYMAVMERMDNVRGEAKHIAAQLRAAIEEARERDRAAVEYEEERRFRASATADIG